MAVLTGFSHRQLHRKGCAVPALANYDAADPDDPSFAGLQVMLDVFVVAIMVGLRHEAGNIMPNNFLFRVSEELFGSRTERGNFACLVDDDHCIRDGGGDGLEMLLAGLYRGAPGSSEGHTAELQSLN